MSLNPAVEKVTARIVERSKVSRKRYLDLMERNRQKGIARPKLACGNLAHAVAASGDEKQPLVADKTPNIGIITTYNDMVSAHQPYGRYPDQIRLFAREAGATSQVAGGAPAMCDGVTQGQDGMDLSLFSRDVIALSTAVGLSHGMYDAVALLGICDKIVPGLLIGALRFGHLPTMLIPAGPMTSGLPNKEKIRVRQLFVQGKIGRDELMKAEMESYHAPGTCTFYGTANTNQMLGEIMGLMMPDAAFIVTNTPERQAATRAGIHRLAEITSFGNDFRPLKDLVTEKAIVNALVGLMATGGSTNLTLHLPAIARAAGIIIKWEDFSDISDAVPLMCRVYPNGPADVNAFHKAGGVALVMKELLEAGLLHPDVKTISKGGMKDYINRAILRDGKLAYEPIGESRDTEIVRPLKDPFQKDGGITVMRGNLGRGVFKTSAVAPEHQTVEAPCRVFLNQQSVVDAQKNGELDKDVVVVVRGQGPSSNGMPELHRLTPSLGVQQDKGYKIALVTDGRMSGASGKVPVALHVYPEAKVGGPIAKLRDGDVVRVCAKTGQLEALVPKEEWEKRKAAPVERDTQGTGRELFTIFREAAPLIPEDGASSMLYKMDEEMGNIGNDVNGGVGI